MYSIKENSNYLYEIKKSKFYVNLYRIDTVNDVDKYLNEVKSKYKDATHYCYAYVLNGYKKVSDDGEPSGTAGIPILEVLDKKNLNYILCVVTRYFGGIKLGAGGLVRAYSNSVVEAINNNQIVELTEGLEIELTATYDNKKDIEYIFKEYIKEVKYDEKITYILRINKNDLEKLSNYDYKIISEILIEKD